MKSQAQGRARRASLTVLLGALAVAGAAGCAAKVDEKAGDPEPRAQQLRAQHTRHFRGPVAVVIDAVKQHADPSAEQLEALDTIASEARGDCESRRALHARLKSSAVAVLRSGSASSEGFEQAVDEAVRAVEERVQRSMDALEEIHGVLEPEQRKAVAEALRAHIAEKFGRDRRDDPRQREGVRRFASYLMLSSLQLDKLALVKKELLGERQELHPSREELLELVDAFEGEDFRAALLAFREKKSQLLRERVARAGERTDAVLSIFTPPQRELLADLILEGPRKVLFGEEFADVEAR